MTKVDRRVTGSLGFHDLFSLSLHLSLPPSLPPSFPPSFPPSPSLSLSLSPPPSLSPHNQITHTLPTPTQPNPTQTSTTTPTQDPISKIRYPPPTQRKIQGPIQDPISNLSFRLFLHRHFPAGSYLSLSFAVFRCSLLFFAVVELLLFICLFVYLT